MKLHPGDKIRFRKKLAIVIEQINADDPSDLRLQGRRWYIESAGFLWSVTEKELLTQCNKKHQ